MTDPRFGFVPRNPVNKLQENYFLQNRFPSVGTTIEPTAVSEWDRALSYAKEGPSKAGVPMEKGTTGLDNTPLGRSFLIGGPGGCLKYDPSVSTPMINFPLLGKMPKGEPVNSLFKGFQTPSPSGPFWKKIMELSKPQTLPNEPIAARAVRPIDPFVGSSLPTGPTTYGRHMSEVAERGAAMESFGAR